MSETSATSSAMRSLIKAFAALANDRSNLRLGLVGDGEMRHALERQIKVFRLDGRIRLHGTERDPRRADTWSNSEPPTFRYRPSLKPIGR